MTIKQFDKGTLNIKRDYQEPYLSHELFIEKLIKELDKLYIKVERTSKTSVSYKGIEWDVTYEMLDDYNWGRYLKCTVWSDLLKII